MALVPLLHQPVCSAPPPEDRLNTVTLMWCNKYTVNEQQQYLFSVFELLLLALWHEVIQPAHLPLGEDTVH